MLRAIFLDRDGTINEDVGNLYQPKNLIFIPQAIDALKILQKDFTLFIVTNQSGIGKNIFSEQDFFQFNQYFLNRLSENGIRICKTYFCPHTKERNCLCHKPSPYFVKLAENDYGISLKESFVIGDHPHDIAMAHNTGCNSVYLLTGHGNKHRNELLTTPSHIANNLYEAAIWIKQVSETI